MKRRTLFLLLFTFSLVVLHAQSGSSWPKTLLWRISGNGLSKNSFLYGTMHLQDKRLFQFGDSLYHYLEQAEGCALEVNVQEFMDSILQKVLSEKEEEIMSDREDDHKEEKKLIDSLIENVKVNKDKKSKKTLEKIRQSKIRKAIKNKEMPTIVDAYLYGIARRQGKWLGGIEDVQDQLVVFDELGNDITSEELLTPENELRESLEQMITAYISQDLDKIEEYSETHYSDKMEDLLLTQRNKKMAMRMDSLSHIRSMFYAIGAAHLPGDKGVINLLRQRGYRVDPVFSSKTLDPEKYVSNLQEVPWVKIEDADQTYEIEMPGNASDLGMYGDVLKFKIYVDITTLTFFAATSVSDIQGSDPEDLIKSLSKNGSKIENKRKVTNNGSKGVEAVISSDGYYFKVQYLVRDKVLYMLMTGGEKKESTSSPDARKFFQSFVPEGRNMAKNEKEWQRFSLDDKAFEVMLPGAPKQNKSLEKKAEGSMWSFTVYDLSDASSTVYYLLQVRDLLPGYYLSGDSSYFSLFRENLLPLVDSFASEEITTVAGFPAQFLEATTTTNNLLYRTMTVNRGNRVYTLMGIGENNDENQVNINRFFNSFAMHDYKKISWKKEWDPKKSFYSTAPAAIEIKGQDDDDDEYITASPEEKEKYYVSYNPQEAISYQVFKTTLSPYYWTTDDSTFLESSGLQYKEYGDSVLSKRNVTNGSLKGMEWVMQLPGNNNLRKLRQFLNGDTLYTLMSFIPTQYIDREEHDQFFSGFRVAYEDTSYSIFHSKAQKLLTDLRSTDSATFTEAADAVSSAYFTEEDRDLLQEALLLNYLDDTTFYTVRQQLAIKVIKMADSTTVAFVRSHFDELKGDREKIKFNLLDILAGYKTDFSYSVLKELLLNHTPLQSGGRELSYLIDDSVELTRKLFPEILTLTNNTLFSERLISICNVLLDSGQINTGLLLPYKENFLYTADTIFQNLQKEDEYFGYGYFNLVRLLAKFNDDDCNKMLKKYLLLDELYVKQEVIIALIKNNQQVDKKEIEKVAADKEYRRDFYNELEKIGKKDLFPSKYLTQKYMAESDMMPYAYDDESSVELEFIGDRTSTFKGEKGRFYLYKVIYTYSSEEDEDSTEPEIYLGVAGPYSMDLKDIKSDNNATGLFYKENFDSKNVNKQFGEFLKMKEQEPKY